jgi:hypothetical protein
MKDLMSNRYLKYHTMMFLIAALGSYTQTNLFLNLSSVYAMSFGVKILSQIIYLRFDY